MFRQDAVVKLIFSNTFSWKGPHSVAIKTPEIYHLVYAVCCVNHFCPLVNISYSPESRQGAQQDDPLVSLQFFQVIHLLLMKL